MTKQEINQKYTQTCQEIGHLTAGIKAAEAQILNLMQTVVALNNQMAAINQAEASIAAEAKAKADAEASAAESKPELSAVT